MSYELTLSKHRRLTILKFLSECAEYTSNASILLGVCHTFGVTSTHDQITGELGWLKENGMITAQTHDTVTIVTITTRGLEIAQGKAFHGGVQRPSPGG